MCMHVIPFGKIFQIELNTLFEQIRPTLDMGLAILSCDSILC